METLAAASCANCSAPCAGAYCSVCGEKQLSPHDFSLRHFVEHAVHDLTHFDAKIFRSLIPLVLRPGVLTAEFVAGRRTRYIKPLTLFILVNLIFFDRSAAAELDRGRADALVALTQALNGPTRCALSLLRAGGNRSGADAVATWQTGYPAAVDFARGHPRYRPLDGTAGARLARGEVDAVLVLGSAAGVPAELLDRIARLPCAVVGPRASESALARAEVVIDTGVAGIHEGGLVLRMDDMPFTLRPSVSGPPAAAALTASLRDRTVRYRDTLGFKYPRRSGRS